MLSQPNQGTVITSSEYDVQSRNLIVSIDELTEHVAQLSARLEPLKSPTPIADKHPQIEPPDAPMSPVCDLLRQSAKKVNKIKYVINDILQQIQI